MKIKQIVAFALSVFSTSVYAYEPAGTPPDWPAPMGEPMAFWKVLGDRVETGFADEADTYVWDVQGWYGGDRNRWWFKTEGEGEQGTSPEDVELQVLFSRMFAPFWDWQVGIRHDFKPNPDRTHVVLGVQGVVPYEFEWASAIFINDQGNVSTRIEVEYDLNITQRWVLQPRFELNAAFSDDPAVGLGSGVSGTELDLRLRYHLSREFAPYVGVAWEQLYGDTKDFALAEGESSSVTSFVVGVRLWF